VTELALRCSLLEIPVDPVALYHADDPLLMMWLDELTDRVSAELRRQQERAKRQAKG
jgi:hypothetical protein